MFKTKKHKQPEQKPVVLLRPPTRGVDKFTLRRESYSESILLTLADKSSYYIELDELKLWMRLVLVHPLRVVLICDVLWNYPELTYTVSEDNLEIK